MKNKMKKHCLNNAVAVCIFSLLFCSAQQLGISSQAFASDSNNLKDRIKIRKKIRLQHSQVDESEEYSLGKIEVLAKKRRNLILDIKRFIRESSNSAQKAELNLRLGGLYLEDYYSSLASAQQKYSLQLQEYESQDKKKRGKSPKIDNSSALASLDRARTIYNDLVKQYPNHSRRDEMIYFLALTSLDRGKTDEGMRYFKVLADQMPKSKYVDEALIQLGDHYFDNNQFKVAEGYYNRLMAKKYRPLLPYATYKKAWCEYNTQHPEAALVHFKWVIQAEKENENAQVRVRKEALKDITLPFVDLKLVEESIEFFRPFGNPFFRDGLSTMASLHFEQGNFNPAIRLYSILLDMDRNFSKNPQFDIQIVESYMLSERRSEGTTLLFERLPIYLEKSTWYEMNSQDPKVVKEASNLFEETARKHSLAIHAEAQKTKNKSLYQTAKQLYSQYIKYFQRTPHTSMIRFYLAEILYKNEEYLKAAKQYYLVYKDPSAATLRLNAIRYSLTSLDHEINNARKKMGLELITNKTSKKLDSNIDTKLELVPYSKVESKFLKISSEYFTVFPTQKDVPDVLYEQSYIYYIHHDLPKAYKGFWVLISKFPSRETSLSSAYLILDILNRNRDYPKLISACKTFLQTKQFSRKSFRDEVENILRKAELKRIQIVEDEGKFREAAESYIEYTKVYGAQDISLFEKALYNASVNFIKADMLLQAVETQEKFLRRFPNSKLSENILLQVSKSYETFANVEKSAAYFELFSTKYPNNKQSRIALRLAGLYYWGSGQIQKAEIVMQRHIELFPRESSDVEKDLLNLYESQNATSKLIQFYSTSRNTKGIPFSTYLAYTMKIAELEGQRRGKIPVNLMQEALTITERNARTIKESPAGIEATAKLYFWFTSKKDDNFRNIQLALPQRQLENNLQRKIELLKVLEREYGEIASLGSGEWGLAAIYKTAEAFHHMAQTVLAAPVPSELTGEQLEIYRKELNKEMITPFNEKALSLAEQCLDKSQELNLMSVWTAKCYALAGRMKTDRYPLARTLYILPLKSALLIPDEKDSTIPLGNTKQYSYPFFSSDLFKKESIKGLEDAGFALPELYLGNISPSESAGVTIPIPLNYQLLSDERKTILKNDLNSERPSKVEALLSFAYLNILRITTPKKSIPTILKSIEKNPKNKSLHNLLGLAYLESGNLPAAKVMWLSLIAQGEKNGVLLNNLGVVSLLEGKEPQAIEYFREAVNTNSQPEALSNLGFIALKYRNGFEAKKMFTKFLEQIPGDATVRVGFAVAQLQNREWQNAKESLISLSKQLRNDPYARLSLVYFLMDVEGKNGLAKQILSDFMEHQSAQDDLLFRRAYQEARQIASSDAEGSEGLPDIE